MIALLDYKGYVGSIEYSADDEVFHGRLEFIRDLVAYEGADIKSIKRAFHEAVNSYLELCAAERRNPDTPFEGRFDVCPGRELHRRAMAVAQRKGVDLNTVVTDALRHHLDCEEPNP